MGLLHVLHPLILYGNAFHFAQPPAFFPAFRHGFSFPDHFSAQVQASTLDTTDQTRPLCLDPHNTLHIPTTSTRQPYDNIYEFNNNTLILNNNEPNSKQNRSNDLQQIPRTG